MHLSKILPLAFLAASAAAQTLIYDNGPIANLGSNLAILQTSVGANPPAPTAGFHSVFGYGVNNATLKLADNFAVSSAMVINEVELFYYQTGATSSTPTCTGVFLEILSGAPNAGGTPVAGSPGIANNLFTTNLVSHTFTGIFKVQDTAQTATNRPIMSVKVSLPTPVVLTNGVYWLQFGLTGSLASGPWCPPISTLNQGATGDAMQLNGATWTSPIVSGTAPNTFAQGLPFRLYGSAGTPGSITQTATGCGSTGITVEGAPTVGGYIRTALSGVTGLGIIGYSFNTAQTVFCGCTFAHGWDISLATSTSTVVLPMDPNLCGVAVGVQGVDFGGAGGCPIGFTVTNGYVFTLNN